MPHAIRLWANVCAEEIHSVSKEVSGSVLNLQHHDRVMRLWKKTVVPALAAVAVVLLAAAGAAGVDQIANTMVTNTASVTAFAAGADSQPSLRHVLIRGLAEGGLPGGSPFDEPREERYDENHQEARHVEPGTPA
ncbi:hypothetical protein ACFC25_17135 [Pseudarthrobacter sp. NPDC055928]|uniref:hypothetical protein n=1 Tax=Pseudarthrobacter sp. NPDC055928 TaxID=3345661 RepID=UPI0035E08969